MRRAMYVVLFFLILSMCVGCGSQTADIEEKSQEMNIESEEKDSKTEVLSEEQAQSDENVTETSTTETSTTGKTLIAYFTWADNTYVENPEEVDVDATTSASVLQPGNVGLIASWLQEETGADVFSIQVEDLYSSDYDECLDRASEENADNARPALATHVENMEQYDTIYLGYPNWWYSTPMAILSFIDEYDFEGKQIVLFCSHGTGGLAGSVDAITAELPEDCSISDNVLGVYRPDVVDSKEKVLAWQNEIQQELAR